MGNKLKHWKPREVVKFLKKQGFIAITSRGKGDHCFMHNPKTQKGFPVDMGRDSFFASEMKNFCKSSEIAEENWKK